MIRNWVTENKLSFISKFACFKLGSQEITPNPQGGVVHEIYEEILLSLSTVEINKQTNLEIHLISLLDVV